MWCSLVSAIREPRHRLAFAVQECPRKRPGVCGSSWLGILFSQIHTEVYDFQAPSCGSAGHPYDLGRIYQTNVCKLDRPEMNSVRDACRGCKAEKPIFLLFRLVEP